MFKLFKQALYCLLLLASLTAPANSDPWFSDTQGIYRVGPNADQVAAAIPFPGIVDLVGDGRGALWALTDHELVRLSPAGERLRGLSLQSLTITEPRALRADARDSSVWIADDSRFVHVSAEGEVLATHLIPDRLQDLVVLPDRSLWILGEQFLWHVETRGDAAGKLLGSIALAEIGDTPVRMAADPIRGFLWLLGTKSLVQVDTSGNQPPRVLPLPRDVQGLAIDPRDGMLWLLTSTTLIAQRPDGPTAAAIDLRPWGIRSARTIAYEPVSGGLWIGHQAGLSRFKPIDNSASLIPHARGVRQFAAEPLTVTPSISLLQPKPDSLIDASGATFVLGFDTLCYGIPCALPRSYAERYRLSATLGTEDIGARFRFDSESGQSRYGAARLPAGPIEFRAQVTDSFGQRSNPLHAYLRVVPSAFAAQPQSNTSAGATTTSRGAAPVTLSATTVSAGGASVSSSTALPQPVADSSGQPPAGPVDTTASSEAVTDRAVLESRYGNLPLHFEINEGQHQSNVRFLSRGPGYQLLLSSNETVLRLRKPKPLNRAAARSEPGASGSQVTQSSARFARRNSARAPHDKIETPATVVRMRFEGANPDPRVTGLEMLPGESNYFVGNDPGKWRTNVAHYAKVKYENVYPGIDKVYYGNQRQVEYDWIVAPGADPSQIRQVFDGADRLVIDQNGDLVIHTRDGRIRQQRPVVYQEVGGQRVSVAGQYVLQGRSQVAFAIGAYDKTRALIIDPVLLGYSTYLGGTGYDYATGIKVDGSGNVYVTGYTDSVDFPTQSPIPGGGPGGTDIFVLKINSAGSALVYSTYVGGSDYDQGMGIAVDSGGRAHVVGATLSTDFPTVNAVQSSAGGGGDAVAFKLGATGNSLSYSTYHGGSDYEAGRAIGLDSSGNAYVAGATYSTDLPMAGAMQATNAGNGDAFVVKLSATGSARLYSTYFGGSDNDEAYGLAVDSSGNAYFAGNTASTDLPTVSAFQSAIAGTFDGFVAKLNATGSATSYATYLGGTGSDSVAAIAVDASGSAYVTGTTDSFDFPLSNPAQANRGQTLGDAFITKLSAAGNALSYSTYLGGGRGSSTVQVGGSGEGDDWATGIVVDALGQAHITGYTTSSDFPIARAHQPTFGGDEWSGDAFVSKLNVTGNAFIYSTYLGGTARDEGTAIALDASGNAYVVGITTSADFPTKSPMDGSLASSEYDSFVAKIRPPNDSIALTSSRNPSGSGDQVTFVATVSGTNPTGNVTFKDGAATLGTVTLTGGSASYSTSSLSVGNHSITARYNGDANNSARTSSALTQSVLAGSAPSVALTTPTNNATFLEPANITATATATTSGGRTISSVVLRWDNAEQYSYSWDVRVTPPYTVNFSALPAGIYKFTANAVDNTGAIAVSAPVTVRVSLPPSVAMTAPAPGAHITLPANVTLTASPTPSPGSTISKVEFFQGATLVGTATTAPYSVQWANPPVGDYTLTAKVTDANTLTATSGPINVSVRLTAAGETITFLHNDVAGSPIAATDELGNTLWKESYRPYGWRYRWESASTGNRQWFHGKPEDDTGLSYFGARYFDTVLGRFHGVDPQGFDEANLQSFNRYAYGNNNPYKYWDPDGQAAETVIDLVSLGLSIAAFRQDPSIANALGLGYDAIAAAVPVVPGGIGILRQAGKAAGNTLDASKATKPDFVVTSDGTAIPASQTRMREGFDNAGFNSRPADRTAEKGVIHEVPTKHGTIDVRTMEGSVHHPRRAITTRSGTNDPVKLSGEKFPNGTPRTERRTGSHLEQTP